MNWEPWTGCYKISDGCTNCYFYGPHAKRYGQNTIRKTDQFDWPVHRNAKGEYNIKGTKILATCFAADFFLPEADAWRRGGLGDRPGADGHRLSDFDKADRPIPGIAAC